jgi:hypothetical protein
MVAFVPDASVDAVVDALAAAGAGVIGDYRRCVWTTPGTGSFVPVAGARPVLGAVGEVQAVPETRVEMVVPRSRRADVIAAVHAAHPYEEPAYYLCALAEPGPPAGAPGRIGRLPAPLTLAGLVDYAARVLDVDPATIRCTGDPDRPIRTVAVRAGTGEAALPAAVPAGADAFLTGELAQRAVAANRAGNGPAILDVGHRTSLRPWLDGIAARLARDLGGVRADGQLDLR